MSTGKSRKWEINIVFLRQMLNKILIRSPKMLVKPELYSL